MHLNYINYNDYACIRILRSEICIPQICPHLPLLMCFM